MAGALGLLSGAVLGTLAHSSMQKEAQKSQQNMAFNQFMLSNFERDPAAAAQFLKTPEGSKIGKKLFGENTDAFTGFLDLHSKAMQASQQQAQQAFGTKDPETLEEWQDHANKLAKFESLHMNEPNFAQIKPQLDNEIKRAEDQVKRLQSGQEHEENIVERQQSADVMHQIAAMNAESNAQFKQFMEQLDKEKDVETNQKNFDGAKSALQHQLDTINKATTGATPMSAEQLKPLIDSYNKQASDLAKRAKKLDVDYDPDEFAPLTAENVENHPMLGSFSGTTTTIKEGTDSSAPITATDPRTGKKVQWDGKAWQPVK
jgi:hypothetical protein